MVESRNWKNDSPGMTRGSSPIGYAQDAARGIWPSDPNAGIATELNRKQPGSLEWYLSRLRRRLEFLLGEPVKFSRSTGDLESFPIID